MRSWTVANSPSCRHRADRAGNWDELSPRFPDKLAVHDTLLTARLERIVRPRAGWLAGPWTRVPIGIICLVLAIIITLPVPLGHVVPGTAISLLALGLIERDGVAIALGIVAAVFGLAVVVIASAGLLNAA